MTDPDTTLTLWERTAAKIKGRSPADTIILRVAKRITSEKDESGSVVIPPASLELLSTAHANGGSLTPALDLALGRHLTLAKWLLDQNVCPTEKGLRDLANHAKSSDDEWNFGNVRWRWMYFTQSLVQKFPALPSWSAGIEGPKSIRVIGVLGQSVEGLVKLYHQANSFTSTQIADQHQALYSLADMLPHLPQYRVAKDGEFVDREVQQELFTRCLEQLDIPQQTMDDVLKKAIVSYSWNVVDLIVQRYPDVSTQVMLDALSEIAEPYVVNDQTFDMMGPDEQHQLMQLLATHLPVDFDFDQKIPVEDALFTLDFSESSDVSIRWLLGEQLHVVNSGLRRRKLMALRKDQPESNSAAAPILKF